MKKAILIILCLCSLAFAQGLPYLVLRSFNGGEMSPLLNPREDLSKFHSGLSLMENIIPLPQGAAEKRPGTVYVAGSKSNTKVRMLPFEFSTDRSYAIEAGNQYFRFFTDNAQVLDGVGTEDLSGVDGGNLVAHWLLDEDEGTTVVNDDNPGTLDGISSTGASNLSVEGKVGTGCFDLDGQYNVYMSDAAALSFTDNTDDEPFSLMCWGYVTEQAGFQNLISKWDETTGAIAMEYRLSLSSERKLQLHLADTNVNLTGDLLAQWYLNDTAGNTHCDEVTTNYDGVIADSEFASTLTATGLAAMTPCYDFDGQYAVEVADAPGLSFDDSGTNPFSITAWVYGVAAGVEQNIISKADFNSGSEAREWRLFIQSNENIVFRLYDESANAYIFCQGSVGAIGWTHIVATYDSSGGVSGRNGMNLYVDNTNVTALRSSDGTYVAMEDTATNVVIGAYYGTDGNLGNYFADRIDNVILFDAEITQATISALYNGGAGREVLTSSATEISAIADDATTTGWHFFTSTYSAPDNGSATAADGIILYVDGVAVDITATNNAAYGAMQDGAGLFRIGAQESIGGAAENFWNDKIDEVSIFKDVLTPTEVASLYSTTEYEITTPYLTADLFELKKEQSADVLYITHPDYEPRKLSRFGNTLWTLTATDYQDGPFIDENADETYFITPSAITGSITLTATGTDNKPFFTGTTAGHEPSGSAETSKSQTGALFKIVQSLATGAYNTTLTNNYTSNQTENTSWLDCGTIAKGVTWYLTTLNTWTGTLEVQRNYTIGAAHGVATWETVFTFQSNDDRNASTNAEETVEAADYRCILTASGDAAETCDVYFRISDTDHVGIVEITSVTSPTVAIGTVVKTLADTTASHRWSEGAWSNYRGWPRAVTFFEDRLTFGGNLNQPDTIWLSVTGDYGNMTAGPDDDEAMLFTLSSRQVNVIEWMVGKNNLIIGTSGAEWTLRGGTDEPLTPSNVKAEHQSTHGSANLQATLASESVLFFQRGAKKMRELAYNWETDAYVAPDMTLLVPEVTGDGIKDMAYQKIPNSILWCVKENGELAIFVYERNELVTSWSRFITDGLFESVAVINGDPEDQVWISVKRTMAGVNQGTAVRYIEYFSARDFGTDPCDAYFVDSGITYDSTATTTITGLTHLEAEAVAVLADGAIQSNKTVSGGEITIASAATVQAGLPFTVQMKTMPLSFLGQGSSILGRIKRVSGVIAEYYNSGDFEYGKDATNTYTISVDGIGSDITDRKTFPAGYGKKGQVFIYQLSPEPFTLVSLGLEFAVF
jgi:hypothetical protein